MHQPSPGRVQHLQGRHDWVVAAASSNADRAPGYPGQPLPLRRASSASTQDSIRLASDLFSAWAMAFTAS